MAPKSRVTRSTDDFNDTLISVRGQHVEHWLNGVKIIDCNWSDPEIQQQIGNSKFKNLVRTLQPEGHIVLQQRLGEVWFRNIRIRRLPDEGNVPAATIITAPAGAQNYSTSEWVSIDLGSVNRENGLTQLSDITDGPSVATNLLGRECRYFYKPRNRQAHCYLKIDPTFKHGESMNVRVVVDFYDATPGALDIDYDGPTKHYNSAGRKPLQGDHTWKTEEFHLKGCKFRNGQNQGADFRLRSVARELYVRRVVVFRE
jgi:hypothetical protein